ncbi:DUF4870 domain-containing protein [Cellulophaga baltica]|uniref:DUF4870 domain-containing protein n=1 Tax=Cellulophaga TaxID=104264 RepID=UPI001C06716D|nr:MULTISPECIES: DUF4870 domain-containing protein [Cellulophaga]MBU2998185.1 DUF4870 domain-containing protein [Cellulophaga baltica]MDO6769591.1 DUF4870 domain-containing protein [Cellulophaga sp. 1_MG-2023]
MNDDFLKEDNSTLALVHYSQLLNFFGFFGLIVPLILWTTKKEEIKGMDAHGKHILNYQLSLLLYSFIFGFLFFISFILMFVLIGFIIMGILSLVAIPLAILLIIYPILGGVSASKGEFYKYPLTINFIS